MKWRSILTGVILLISSNIGAQDLDLNSQSDAFFRSKVDPLAKMLPLIMGGFFSGDVGFLSLGQFRLSVHNALNLPSDKLSVGAMEGVTQFNLPIFYAALGIDPRVELSGKFATGNIGNRAVIITGYGIRYLIFSDESGNNALSFGTMVNALRGPEDFRLWDMTVQFEYLRLWKSRSMKASIGADFSEMRIAVEAGKNLLLAKNENIERTKIWLGLGFVQNIGSAPFIFLQIQQGDARRINFGFGMRF
ncbi:MAG: hypothetical protein IIB39_04435 [Candidatus Marinimicrobia bacterium]|nr:hypothetical protein [Candidatus Neomarinimicrobiota bacterium]